MSLALAMALAACSSATPSPTIGPTPTATATASPDVTAAPTPSPSPSPTPFACTELNGTIVDRAYTSKVTGVREHYRLYLPPCYETAGRRFPYVILFHGSLDDHTEWTEKLHVDAVLDKGIAAGTLAPMIVVMPEGGAIANGHEYRAGKSYESVILDEIVPRVEAEFATFGTREGREIGGISRGGFWAFSIAFRHPDLFAAVGGHSPFFHPTNAPATSNPLDPVEDVSVAKLESMRIWVDRGAQDYAEPGITPFVETLERREIESDVKLYATGTHSVAYWKSHVATYLAWYGKEWPQTYQGLPLR